MSTPDRKHCLCCGATQSLAHHHVIPKALARQVGADYWNLWSSRTFVDHDPPEAFQKVVDRWAALPHYTQRLCPNCHKQTHRETKAIAIRIRKAQRSKCMCFECQFWRDFDLGNLFLWFAPESPLAQESILYPKDDTTKTSELPEWAKFPEHNPDL